ncbi:MAG: hypothetical protein U9R50_05010, partial [Campylobacterota bacterium]|nr:hypothetical protein [Campylobacterota bacterium]
RYTVFSKFSNRVEEHPNDWKGFVPDLIIMKKNKVRCFIFETAQSILEEQFLKRAEQLSHVSYKDFKIEPNLVIRSKETYRQCAEILKEYEFNIKIKLMKKSTKPKKVLRE